MRYRLLELIKCPKCGTNFRVSNFENVPLQYNHRIENISPICVSDCPYSEVSPANKYNCKECYFNDIYTGILQCRQNHFYPITNGIPRILPNAIAESYSHFKDHLNKLSYSTRNMLLSQLQMQSKNFEKFFKHTQKSFTSEWKMLKESERAWGLGVSERLNMILKCFEIQMKDLKGKLFLDAGCGHGEVEMALLKSDAEVFATDLSFSVDRVKEHLLKANPNHAPFFHIVQSNIHELPFNENAFDMVYSGGVLHHTPDTFYGFKKISSCLKNQGKSFIELYSAERKNPILFSLSRILRTITIQLPHPILHALCFSGAPFLWSINRIYNLIMSEKIYKNRTLRECELSLFDGFSPRYQHHHTTKEVRSWFAALGYISVKKTFENKNGFGMVGIMQSDFKNIRS